MYQCVLSSDHCNSEDMKKYIALLFILSLIACGGSGTPSPAVNVARTESSVAITSGSPVSTADLSITGMTCGMGCGGAIKNALAKLPGVNGTEIQFESAEQANHAVVTYDPAKVSDAELIQAVQSIHEGQYKVQAVGITKQVLSAGSTEGQTEAEEAKVNATLPDVVLPSIVALLSRLLRI